MKEILFNGSPVYARKYDDLAHWGEIPMLMACDGLLYCPLSATGEPIFILVDGDVEEICIIDPNTLAKWILWSIVFYFSMCGFGLFIGEYIKAAGHG